MTVSELIAVLEKMPQDARVFAEHYETGIGLIEMPKVVHCVPSGQSEVNYLFGSHEINEEKHGEVAVFLPVEGR